MVINALIIKRENEINKLYAQDAVGLLLSPWPKWGREKFTSVALKIADTQVQEQIMIKYIKFSFTVSLLEICKKKTMKNLTISIVILAMFKILQGKILIIKSMNAEIKKCKNYY